MAFFTDRLTERFAVAAVATEKQLKQESAYQIPARGPNSEGDPPKADSAAESELGGSSSRRVLCSFPDSR